MNFVFPKVLLLLWLFPLIPGILFWRRKKRRERLLRFGQSSSVFVKTQKEWIFPLQLAMCTAGMLLMLAAAARPQWGMREETLTSSSRNVLLLLDVSRSMLATDVYPDRLSRAKEDLLELAEKLEWDRAALMVFRARTTLLCPFTTDTNFLKQTIADTVIEMAPAGETDIGGALADALRTFDSFGSDSNSILLLSDGEDLSTHAEEMAKECAARNIPVFCIGVGHRSGAAIPISETQTLTYQGKEVISKLNPEALMEIARLSGGFYLPIESTFEQSLGTIYRERVRDRMKQETHERIEQRYIERYALFLIPGLLLLVFAALFSKGRPAKRARRTGAKSSLAALFFAGFSLFAPALSAQTAPEVSRPDPQQQKLDFNAGLVALQEKNYGQAAALFEKSGRREALAGIGVARYYAALENAEKKLSSCTNLTQRASCTREKLEGLRAAAMALRADAMARAEESSGTESDPKSQYAVNLSLVLEELQKTVRQYEEEKKQLLIDGKDLLEQLKFLLKEQRAVHQNVSDAEVGKITERLPLLEGAAARQENVVFLWEHVLKQLQGTITNQTEAAVFDKNVAPFLEKAAQARLTLEENPLKSALPALETASLGALHLYGVAAPPLDALDFAITSQSNALVRTAAPQQILTPVREQQNAAFLFSVFAEKYHAAAPAQDFISTNDVSAAEVPPEVPGEGALH